MSRGGKFARGGAVREAIAPAVGQKCPHVGCGNFAQRFTRDVRAPMQLQKPRQPIGRCVIGPHAMRRQPAVVG